jgi:predicted metal-dependent phosphoesterase TrpH
VSRCAEATPREQAKAYKERGYAGIIVTDHFLNGNTGCPKGLSWADAMTFFCSGYEAAKAEGDKLGLDVFFGLEYAVRGTEFLLYGLTPEFLFNHPGMDTLSAAQISALTRSAGGYVAQAHPYRSAWWIERPYPVDPGLIDGIETFNAGNFDPEINALAHEFAELNRLPAQSGTDSHFAEQPFTGGVALRERAGDIFDIINAIKTGRVELITP